ncbi:uncharacterized protein LOC103506184 [Diaphorina citri]|uniref:Uncharacterized protein LOC103506184 n=1 Tax=Diaphorina citri TaxID=121845 RepID=A0A3Q0IRZ3_DIACI|nr:uncharacterized protein LOC103506184 [Diaphorina citri]
MLRYLTHTFRDFVFSVTVLFPVVHFKEEPFALQKTTFNEELSNDIILHQGVYREVRCITPEDQLTSWSVPSPHHKGYIMLGFKSLDNSFNKVMVDSWKDWTGARYIYMYLPDELGLSKITFYHREAPDSLDMFMYIVLVECNCITTPERQVRFLLYKITFYHREAPDSLDMFKTSRCSHILTGQNVFQDDPVDTEVSFLIHPYT